MGNGTSQSVMLGPSRSLGHSMQPARFERSPAKYAQPNNRVLPKPVLGQRLRSTDNGHILHSAGTIRGLKSASPIPLDQEEGDPEVMGILKRRSEMIEKEQQNCNETNLRSHRMFYSDSDISQCRPTYGYSPDVQESASSRRPCGAVASRTNKIKQRKKARAPEPPPTDFSGQFQRRAQSTMDLTQQRNFECRCTNGLPEWKPKSRAPPPPPANVHSTPPDPPPPPVMTRGKPASSPTIMGRPFTSDKPEHFVDRLSNVVNSDQFRAPQVRRHSPDNTRLSCSVGDLRLKDEQRNTVFDSKSDLSRSKAKPNLLPQQPDPFQKEIEAVTKKIAQSRQKTMKPSEDEEQQTKDRQKLSPPKQYYFSDKDVFRTDASKTSAANLAKNATSEAEGVAVNEGYTEIKRRESSGESPLQRFSPNRRRVKSPIRSSKDEIKSAEKNQTKSIHNDDDSDIDLRLRPVLPRKTPNIKIFSPTEIWQALDPDSRGSINRPANEDSIQYYNQMNDKFQNRKENGAFSRHIESENSYNCSLNESHWTPRQDLDDSDSSSVNSDDVVLPKNQLGEFSTRFSLPTVMYSNMRPIGSDISTPKRSIPNCHEFGVEETPRFRQMKKKPPRPGFANSDMNSASHFKKFLGMKNKYLSEEDVSVSDSNWTFGGNGLQQKRGKQYSSDLMLSDKKKYELVVKNPFGEFLGDILVTKANDMRNKMRQVDSRHSNFSFYSTEGHVMYLPKSSDCEDYLSTVRSKFDKTDEAEHLPKNGKRMSDLENSSSIDLVRMLEDDVRRRRSKEKLCIRKQLQMMKRLDTEDEETEEEIDEAYFTEPKSLEGSSPLHMPSTKLHYLPELRQHAFNNCANSAPLKHWTSSPALLDDHIGKPSVASRAFLSSSSATSSPDPTVWPKPQNLTDKWFHRKQQSQNRRYVDKQRRVSEGDSSPPLSNNAEKVPVSNTKDQRKMTSGPAKSKKTSIYKQLMDIVRREEKQMKKAQGNNYDPPVSRESSYSQRESSHSSSHDSMSSSYSDSSSNQQDYCGNGVPANDEFHTSTMMGMQKGADNLHGKTPTPFQVAFVQPFSPNKGYRPVPFDLGVPAAAAGNCRMPTLQEGHKFQAEVS